jgi:hypothetical protein
MAYCTKLLVASAFAVLSVASSARADVIYDLTLAATNPATPNLLVVDFTSVPTTGAVSDTSNTSDFKSLVGTIDGTNFGFTSFAGESLSFNFTGGVLTSVSGDDYSGGSNGPHLHFFNGRYSSHDTDPETTGDITIALAVPEPSTWVMMVLGCLGLGLMAYRRKPTLQLA